MKQILVIIGGSGTGKSTIARNLEERGFGRLVTTTTRSKREGEINGIHYHFVSKEEFWKIDRVEENKYVGNWYGLSKAEVRRKMDLYDYLVIVMDVNGAIAMKKEYGDIVTVVFLTISKEEMKKRLRERGDHEQHIQERLQQAENYQEFSKPDVADLAIMNKSIEETVKHILTFMQKERSLLI